MADKKNPRRLPDRGRTTFLEDTTLNIRIENRKKESRHLCSKLCFGLIVERGLQVLTITPWLALVLLGFNACEPKESRSRDKPQSTNSIGRELHFVVISDGKLTLFTEGMRSELLPDAPDFYPVTDFEFLSPYLYFTTYDKIVRLEIGNREPLILDQSSPGEEILITDLETSPDGEVACVGGFTPSSRETESFVSFTFFNQGKTRKANLGQLKGMSIKQIKVLDNSMLGSLLAFASLYDDETGTTILVSIDNGGEVTKVWESSSISGIAGAGEVQEFATQEAVSAELEYFCQHQNSLLLFISILYPDAVSPRTEIWTYDLDSKKIIQKLPLTPPDNIAFVDFGYEKVNDDIYFARLSELEGENESQKSEDSSEALDKVNHSSSPSQAESKTNQQILFLLKFNLIEKREEKLLKVDKIGYPLSDLFGVSIFPEEKVFVLFFEQDQGYLAVPLSFSGEILSSPFTLDRTKVEIFAEEPKFKLVTPQKAKRTS